MTAASATRRGLARVILGLALAGVTLLGPIRSAHAQFLMGGMGYGAPMLGYGYGYPLGGYGFGMGYGAFGYGFGGWGWGGPVMMGIPQPFNTAGWMTTGGFTMPGMLYGGGGFGYGYGPGFGYGSGGWEGWNNPANLSLGITPVGIQAALMERGLAGTGLPAGGKLVPGTYRIEIINTDPKGPSARANDQAPPPPTAPR